MADIRKIELFESDGNGNYTELSGASYIEGQGLDYGNKEYLLKIDSIFGIDETAITKTVFVAVDGDLDKNTFYIINHNDWISVIRTRNKVVFKFENNYDVSERDGDVYFFHSASNDIYARLKIQQSNHSYSISVTSLRVDNVAKPIEYIRNNLKKSNIYSLKNSVIYFEDEDVKIQIETDEYEELTYAQIDYIIHTYKKINSDNEVITVYAYNNLDEEEKTNYQPRFIYSNNVNNTIISKSQYEAIEDESEKIKFLPYEFKFINSDNIIDYNLYYGSNAKYQYEIYSYIKEVNSPDENIPEYGREYYEIYSYRHKEYASASFQEDYEPLLYENITHNFVQIDKEEFEKLSLVEQFSYEVFNYKTIGKDIEEEDCLVITRDEYIKLSPKRVIVVQEYDELNDKYKGMFDVYELENKQNNEIISKENFINIPLTKNDYYVVGEKIVRDIISQETYVGLDIEEQKKYDLFYELQPYPITDSGKKKEMVTFAINCEGGSKKFKSKVNKYVKIIEGGTTVEGDTTINEEYEQLIFDFDFNITKTSNQVVIENFGNINSMYTYYYIIYSHTVNEDEYEGVPSNIKPLYYDNNDGTYTRQIRETDYENGTNDPNDEDYLFGKDKYIEEKRLIGLTEITDLTPYERYFVDENKLHLFGPHKRNEEDVLMDDIYYVIKLMHYDIVGVSETIRLVYDYYPDEYEDVEIKSTLNLITNIDNKKPTDISFDNSNIQYAPSNFNEDAENNEDEMDIVDPYIEIPIDTYEVDASPTVLTINAYVREGDGIYVTCTSNIVSKIMVEHVEGDLCTITFNINRNKFTAKRSCVCTAYNSADSGCYQMFTIIQNGKK